MQRVRVSFRQAITTPLGLVGLALCLRLMFLPLTAGLDFDIASYHIQAQSIVNHQNIYVVTNRYP